MQTVIIDCGSATSLAIEQAAYRLAPIITVEVSPRTSDQDSFTCQIGLSSENSDEIDAVAQFRRHVNDYFLREKIAAKTEGLRILLYAQAFSQAAKSQ
jgi:His-Xaa-Ser system protein HxsD